MATRQRSGQSILCFPSKKKRRTEEGQTEESRLIQKQIRSSCNGKALASGYNHAVLPAGAVNHKEIADTVIAADNTDMAVICVKDKIAGQCICPCNVCAVLNLIFLLVLEPEPEPAKLPLHDYRIPSRESSLPWCRYRGRDHKGDYPNHTKFDGEEVEPDTSGLYTTGKAERVNGKGEKLETIIYGTAEPPKPIDPTKPDDPVKPAEAETGSYKSEPLYLMTDKDGRSIAHKTERKDSILTITVDADFAILSGKLSGIDTLKRQGIERIVFVTNKATSTFKTADLLEKGKSGDTYKLIHNDKTVTFTVGEKKTDIKSILMKS